MFVNNDSQAESNNSHCRINRAISDLGGNRESVNNAGDAPDCPGFNTDTEANIKLSATLANNSGLTQTLALYPNSSVNALIPTSDNLCPERVGVADQRYFLRAVDRVPGNFSFIPNSFNNESNQATGGLQNSDRGIQWLKDGNTESLTNAKDGDIAQYFPPDVEPYRTRLVSFLEMQSL